MEAQKIFFRSTNRQVPTADFRQALLQGQPADYGLYVPENLPVIERSEIEGFSGMSYPEIAYRIAARFLSGQIEMTALKSIVMEAYDFDVPLQKAGDDLHIMWLNRGPTASFKDFAARFMAGLMEYFARDCKTTLTVLVATSGDTGGAIANAFQRKANIRVVVLFPEQEVTARQRKQMTTLGGNIIPLALRGKFDDCQAIVKRAFNDSGLSHLNLTSANSINFGRLLPQTVYYFYACSRIKADKMVFAVPSGNFGNLMGGVYAREMGLDVKKFIAAVNENDEFPRFLQTGSYRPVVPSRECSSNAMNVGHPSNLARLVDLYGGWLTDERNSDGSVARKGVLKTNPDMCRLRNDFDSYAASEKEVDDTILSFYRDSGILLEPHGAVAVRAVLQSPLKASFIALETADPAKFPEKIIQLVGREPELPASLAGLDESDESFQTIDADYGEFRNVLGEL